MLGFSGFGPFRSTPGITMLLALGGLSSDAMLDGRVEAVRPPVAGDNAREYPVGDIVPGDGWGARCNLALREGLVACDGYPIACRIPPLGQGLNVRVRAWGVAYSRLMRVRGWPVLDRHEWMGVTPQGWMKQKSLDGRAVAGVERAVAG